MHALSLALLLAAGPPAGAEGPGPAAAPIPPPSPPASPASSATPGAAAPLSPAAIEKLGQGDRAFLDRDYRNALFAYMDASYLAPGNPAPRVKLGRAYLALRYPARAIEQAEKALAVDPANAEAKKLLQEARSAGLGSLPPPHAPPAAAPGSHAPAPAAQPSSRVFRFVPDPEPGAAAAQAPTAPARAAPAARGDAPASPPPAAPPAAVNPARTVAAVDSVPSAAPTQGASAAQRYRLGLELLQNREFEKAIAALTEAVALDPRLAVAYAARASARFGLGRYREAADDYRAAIDLDAKLGTPLYGLAECYRVLGESKNAAEMYRRYAESRASDVRDDLRAIAARRAQELR